MDISEKMIRSKYSSMDILELRALRANPGITETASRILDEILHLKSEDVKSGNTIEKAYDFITTSLARGDDINVTLKHLSLQGVSPAVLNGAMAKLKSNIAESRKSPAKRNIILGSILLATGAGVTGYTYFLAAQEGGHYFILWGLMLVGGITLMKGFYHHLR